MNLVYRNFKFPDSASAKSVLYSGTTSIYPNMYDNNGIGIANQQSLNGYVIPTDGTYYANIVFRSNEIPAPLQPYLISFPPQAKHVWFTNEQGASL